MQMNTRIDDDMKRAGDAILRRYGLTPSAAVRALWEYLVETNSLPEFLHEKHPENARAQDARQAVEQGAGYAVRLAREAHMLAEFDALSYDELREAAFEEELLEKESRL